MFNFDNYYDNFIYFLTGSVHSSGFSFRDKERENMPITRTDSQLGSKFWHLVIISYVVHVYSKFFKFFYISLVLLNTTLSLLLKYKKKYFWAWSKS